MSTDHRITVADAAKRMGLRTQDVKLMVFAYKLEGGRDEHGMYVDDRSVARWLENNS